MTNYDNVNIGEEAPDVVNVIIEIARGSQNKYEIDKETGIITLDRVLYSSVHYPTEYGYIPQTLCEDGDSLDVMLLGSDPLIPGCVARMRPIALMKMIDDGEQDNKILGVQADNPRFNAITTFAHIEQFMPHLIKEITHYFSVMKQLQGKVVEVKGWENEIRAKEEILRTQKLFQEKK